MAKNSSQLARKITMPLLLFYGLGNILGAGIYVLIGEMANIAGMYVPVAFLIALSVVLFTAFSYGEMVSRYPIAAGGAIFVYKGFHSKKFSLIFGLTIAMAGLVSAATLFRGFTGYMSQFALMPESLSIILIVVILGVVAIWGIGESVWVASLITLVEISGLLLIIWLGAPYLLTVPERIDEFIPPLNGNVWQLIFLSSFLAFFAFTGFEDMVNVAEEVKDPARSFPKAIILSCRCYYTLYNDCVCSRFDAFAR